MRKESYHFGVYHCLHSFLSMHVKHFRYETMFGSNFQNLQSVANHFGKPQSTYQCLYLFLNRCGL